MLQLLLCLILVLCPSTDGQLGLCLNDRTPVKSTRFTNSSGWQQVAGYFDEAVDESVAPCDNFYAFACGKRQGTGKEPPENDLYDRAKEERIKSISSFEVNQNTPHALRQAKLVYDKCLSLKEENIDITRLFPTIDNFLGGWPLLQRQKISTWDPFTLMGKLDSLGIGNLFKATIEPNQKDHKKGNMIRLKPAEPLLEPKAYGIRNTETMKYFQSQIGIIVQNAASILGLTLDQEQLRHDIKIMLMIDYRLMSATKMADKFVDWTNATQLYNVFNVTTATERWPNIDWEAYLCALADRNFDPEKIMEKDFNIQQPDFVDVLAQLPLTPGKWAAHLQNYLVFKFVWEAIKLMPLYTELSSHLRWIDDVKQDYEQDVDKVHEGDDDICSKLVFKHLPWAGARMYIDYSFNKVPDKPREALHLMTYMVLEGFMTMIKDTPWMTEHSKLGAYEKIFKVQKNVAYPLWIMDNEELDARHPIEKLNITTNDDPFRMFYKLVRFSSWFYWHKFLEPVDRTEFACNPSEVNAYYMRYYNSINLPAAFLHAPTFHVDFPMVYNYAYLGFTVGHELVHGFDNEGSQYDEKGRLITWIDDHTYRNYNVMCKCLVNQYNQFRYRQLNDIHVDGEFTLAENIADNAGLGASYLGYKAYVEQFGEEPSLPGRWGNYTMEQIFFISYAQNWCGDEDTVHIIQNDPHSPLGARVIGPLQNYPPFHKAFGCKVGDPMSPKRPCLGWYSPTDE